MIKMFKYVLILTISPLCSSLVYGSENRSDDEYLQISSVKVEEISETSPDFLAFEAALKEGKIGSPDLASQNSKNIFDDFYSQSPSGDSDVFSIVPPVGIINTGSSSWSLIKKNKIVLSHSKFYANALPKDISWVNLVGWKNPTYRMFSITLKNGYNMDAVRSVFVVSTLYGGNIEGRGNYIGSVSVLTDNVRVLMGWRLNVFVRITHLMNAGTKDDPLASLILDIKWRVSNLLFFRGGDYRFHIQGDGLIRSY